VARGRDVVIVGAGVIGAATAWRCAQRGMSVTLVDPDPSRGAWHTAAGMLAPITELHYTETPLLRLGLESLSRYPRFAAELTAESGQSLGFRECGTVLAAWDAADFAALCDLQTFAGKLGVDSELVTGKQLRSLEPALTPGLPGALHAPGDHQVDPRLLHAALLEAAQKRGAQVVNSEGSVLVDKGRVRGVAVAGGTVISTRQAVIAAGCWSAQIAGVPEGALPRVRPVKGQTLRLRLPGTQRLQHVVRASVKGSAVYLVPRSDGGIVVGASLEERGFDREPRAGAVYELLRDAQTVLPELSEAVLEEVSTGLRPGSPDNAPIVGPTEVDGLIHATGHYRNGILLTPVTADAIAALLAGGALPTELAPFSPARFAAPAATARPRPRPTPAGRGAGA
jgi:glycine oxidase